MTPKEISQLDNKMRAECFINNKTGKEYYVLDVAMDATNAREGNPVVIYTTPGINSTVFVRDLEEFMEKFTKRKGKNKMIIFIINGAPRTGKDTFIKLLQKINKERVIAYSSIDWVKNMAYLLGWNGEKDTKGRQFLSDIKDACTKYADIPFKKITKTIKAHYEVPAITPKYCCVNVRETVEIQKLVEWCAKENVPCHTVWIRNKKAEQRALDNHFLSNGDTQFLNYNYDLVINNDGTLMDFEIEIENKINTLEKVAA